MPNEGFVPASRAATARIDPTPLVGVLTAIMVVVLIGLIPPPAMHYVDDQFPGCSLCLGGDCRETREVELQVSQAGLLRVAGRELPLDAIPRILRLDPEAPGFGLVQVRVHADGAADYGDVMQVVDALRRLGLADRQVTLSHGE